ncbi:MAG TPA: cytochrome c oxidase assembly protein [Methylomirabilota bacterium]|nr:cytochrome c oxidase assembly protein [Methylomirabilota bacterium]
MNVAKPWLGVVIVLVLAGCAQKSSPEETAIAYGRALYASDADALWRLISETDRRHKDEATFRRQQHQLKGFTREAVEQLARHIDAAPLSVSVAGDRATVILKFRLPDANAPAIRRLMHDWDEDRLDKLSAGERTQIRERLDGLAREHRLPIVEGDETIELIREAGTWHVFLNWAGGVRVTFDAAVDPGLPLDVKIAPVSIVLARGERVRVSVRARNTGARELTTRVSHRTEPATEANHLALLQCPLLVPVRVASGEVEEYESEYLLLPDVPESVKALTVTYRFPTSRGGRP